MDTRNGHRERGAGATIRNSFLLQWHITERCNLRCAHCYQEATPPAELGIDGLKVILEQYRSFLAARPRRAGGAPARAQITVTGGEPFLRSDCLEFLDLLAADAGRFRLAILTNGTLIDDALARRLATLAPAFVQVSIDGTRDTHDTLRGRRMFDRAVAGIRQLVRHRIHTLIAFTAHRGNYREFPAVAKLGRRLGVARVWADRFVPFGTGSALRNEVLTPTETREFVHLIATTRRKLIHRWSRTEIAAHRALQFLGAGGRPYACTAGRTLLAVLPNGDLLPCRRMPIRIGNLLETPLGELYAGSDLLRGLRNLQRQQDICPGCVHARFCRGGLRCLANAVHGDPFVADPGCWLMPTTSPSSGPDDLIESKSASMMCR